MPPLWTRSRYYKRVHIPRATRLAGLTAALVVVSVAVAAHQKAKPTPTPPEPPLEILWHQRLPVTDESARTPGLVAGDAFVFVASPGGALTAHDPAQDGRIVWSKPFASVLRPAVAGARIAIVTDAVVHVLDQRTGEPAWFSEVDPGTSALVSLGDRLAALAGEELRSWDAEGAPAWRVKLGGVPVTPVVSSDGVIYAGLDSPADGARGGQTPAFSLVAIDAATGKLRWTHPLPAKPDSLAVKGDQLYLGAANETLYTFPTAGQADPAWKFRVLRFGRPAVRRRPAGLLQFAG